MNDQSPKIVLIAKNPSQYHGCLYRELNKVYRKTEVWYLKDNPILIRFGQSESSTDMFGKMLDGHFYRFILQKKFKALRIILDLISTKPDFVIFTGYDSLLFFILPLMKIIGIKLIWRGEIYHHITGKKRILLKPFLNLYDAHILSTKRAVNIMADIVECHKLKYVPSCVDSEYLCDYYGSNINNRTKIRSRIGLNCDDIVINITARFSHEKNIEEIIKIIHEMKSVSIKLLLVGSGEYQEKLVSLVDNLNLTERVIFTGFQTGNDLYDCYIASDYAMNMSHWDYSPKSINESLHFGLIPIFSKKIGTYQELTALEIPYVEVYSENTIKDNASLMDKSIKVVGNQTKNDISSKSKKFTPRNFSRCIVELVGDL